jgi:hypothetical protein
MREMRRGRWEAAWCISDRICRERRGREPRDPRTGEWLPRHLQWLWDGAPLNGKRVLVRCYHGLGDTIQFIRFVPLLRRGAAHVTVSAQRQLLPLLAGMEGIDALDELDEGPCRLERDADIEVMELPHALRVTLETLPNTVPYIPVRSQSRAPRALPHVGLVWQAGDWNPHRCVPPELLEKLTWTRPIHFRLLQRGPGLRSWRGNACEIPVIRDIVEEAIELRSLDLLICVDTLSAHLAGALGVPTWLLLPRPADWRWMDEREDSPWYPSMRLFRQSRPGDWHPVVARVEWELRRLFG